MKARWLGLAAIALAQLMIVIDMTIVNVALPSIDAALRIADADRFWVIAAYTLPFAGLLLWCGQIADRVGRRRALIVGLVGFAAASAVGGSATGLGTLLAARAAQGACGALLAPASLALLAAAFTDQTERGRAFGIFGAVVAAGSPIGLVLGGVLTTYAGWHWVFYVNVPVAVCALAGVHAFLAESRAEAHPGTDVPGVVLATAGLVGIVWGLSADTWPVVGAGVLLLVTFAVVESRVRAPLLPLSLVRDRARGGAYLIVLLMMAGPFGVYLFTSFFLQDVQHYSALRTGLAFLPLSGGVMLAAGVLGRWLVRVQPRLAMALGLLLGASGMVLLTRMDAGSHYLTGVLPSLVIVGIGMGTVLPAALELSTRGVGPGRLGLASAMFNVAQQAGASLSTALLGAVAATAADAVHGYHLATLSAAGILALAAVLAACVVPSIATAARSVHQASIP